MKKFLTFVLALVLVVAMVPLSAGAAEIVASGTCGAEGDNLTWTLTPDNVMTISGMGDMADCEIYESPWHDYSVETIIIEDGVTNIGEYAFNECTELTDITIPSSVTSIRDEAFYFCNALTDITIPDSVTSIGAGAFDRCYSLTSVTLPNSITTIAEYTFSGCYALTSITIPNSVTSLERSAFQACSALTSVTIPASVTTIGDYTFAECRKLASVVIPDSVTTIGRSAFGLCNALTGVTIPSSVTSIGDQAFGYYLNTTTWNIEKVSGFTITGYTGTAAETYAKDNEFTFIALDEKEAPEFNDVKESDWFYTPVQWAVANNVTAGTSDTTFSPSNKCTREQAVTFLWNAKGQPEPEGTENPFTDVKEGAWYYKAVLWAVENNITAGVSADKFGVGQPCTRGQIVTFFYNYAERPDASGTNPFTDVPESQWYYEPVLWAVSNGVTAGMTPTTFGPTSTCTRGQIVTFLYNYLGKE